MKKEPTPDQSTAIVRAHTNLGLSGHALASGNWEEAAELLCDLRFIEERCRIGEVSDLQAAYLMALENLPEARTELTESRRRDERIARWTSEIMAYARAWNDARDRIEAGLRENQLPALPEIVPSIRPRAHEEIEADTRRIVESPSRFDRLRSFAQFVSSEAHNFARFSALPMFCIQQAYNSAASGPVAQAARRVLELPHSGTLLLRTDSSLPAFNSRPACLRTLAGHTHEVGAVSVTADGRMALSGSYYDSTLRIWDLETGRCLRTLEGHDGVSCVSVTPDGRMALSGGSDNTLRLWEIETGRCVHALEGNGSGIISVSMTPDGSKAISGSFEANSLQVWDLQMGRCVRTLEGHTSWSYAVNVTPDGRKAISGSNDKTLRVWDLETGRCVQILEGHGSEIACVSMTPDGSKAISGSYYGSGLRVWDLKTGRCEQVFEEHEDTVRAVRITPDGCIAVSGSDDNTIRVWDLETSRCVRTLKGQAAMIESLDITPDASKAVSGGFDGTVRLWDLETAPAEPLETDGPWAFGLHVALRGRRAVVGGGVWDLETGCEITIWTDADNIDDAFSSTPDRRWAISGMNLSSRTFNALRVREWKSVCCVIGIENVSSHVVVPDGRRVVSGSYYDTTLRVWDLATGHCLQTMDGHSKPFYTVAVTPDGRRAVTGSSDSTLRVWDLETGGCLQVLEGHTSKVNAVNVTPDGRRAISGSDDNTLRVWDLRTGRCIETLKGHCKSVDSVSLLPDGKGAVSGSSDNTLRVWDLETGSVLAVLPGIWRPNSMSIGRKQGRIVGEAGAGEMFFLHQQGAPSAPAVLTIFSCCGEPDSNLPRYSARCPVCGKGLEPAQDAISATESICSLLTPGQSPCLDLPDNGFTDPRLLSTCPQCSHPLRFNPFLAGPHDYEQVLRRGLERSRREKGKPGGDVLAHFEALISLLERTGRSQEADSFARERDRFTFHLAARNAADRTS